MYNNYDYPCGADTPDAPYNQTTPPERDFDILVCTSLSKSTYITTDKYCKITGILIHFFITTFALFFLEKK